MKNVLVVLVVAVLAFVAFVASRPADFRVERSATIAAPPESLYARIADFHRWDAWSPWAKLDPTMKESFAGPESGVGADYRWVGSGKVGEGRMTVTEAVPSSRVVIRLEFIKPFPGVSTCTFSLAPGAAGTKVDWTMEGKNNFVGKAMCLFMNMDKAIGPDFERGLGNLASVATAPAPGADSTAAPAKPS